MWRAIFPILFAAAVSGATFDLLIRHARLADGTGSPAVHADIGIREGRVARIGHIPETEAARVIDATGLVATPGFIDVHTHAEDILDLPAGENFIRMGVTTLMLGNCGGSASDIAQFLQKVEKLTTAPNVATLVGHNTVRRKAMGGSFNRRPSEEELQQMRELMESAMKAGAFGLSTGLIYLPGTFSKTEEIIELAKIAGKHGGIYASHMRDEGLQIDQSLNELFRIAREGGIRAHISHIKLSGKSAWGRAEHVLDLIEQARERRLDITQDQYVYTASSTGIAQLVPDWAREGDKYAERLADPALKAKMKEDMKATLKRRGFSDFSFAVVAHYRDPALEDSRSGPLDGLNIVEAAQKKRGSASLDDQMEIILEIQGRASGVFHGMSEEDLQIFLKHPNTMLASDSGVRKYQEGVPHPRGYGNNARALGRYVRELKVLRLEEAVRRMTSLPANTFRIAGRGQVHEGFWADVVLFDPTKVQDLATYPAPHQYPAGIEYVLVNGIPVLEKGALTQQRPGRALRLGLGQ